MNQRQREFVRQRAGVASTAGFHNLRRWRFNFIANTYEHGGHEPSNICFCCRNCNLYKGPNQTAYDPDTDELVTLFNPRTENWEEHFRLEDGLVIGISAKGRATVELLQMNMIQSVQIREFAATIEHPRDS